MQALAPEVETYLPGGQDRQEEEPAKLYLPPGQTLQVVTPVVEEYLPASQFVQAVTPDVVSAYCPALHKMEVAKQDEAAAKLVFEVAQVAQVRPISE